MSPAIELRGVEKNFGITSVIRNVNLTVAQGERHALIGPNGAGKSTLFNLISGYMTPTTGSILLRDQVISGLPPYQINRRGLSRSFQVTNVFANMTRMGKSALRRAVGDRPSLRVLEEHRHAAGSARAHGADSRGHQPHRPARRACGPV